MQMEYDALVANNTWTITDLPSGATIVGCKWVFKNKFNVDASFQRHKAHLATKGFHQTIVLDYTETFNLVIKPTTVCVVKLSCPISFFQVAHSPY